MKYQKTPFQQEFKVNNKFYSGDQIRSAIKKYFPKSAQGFDGLAYIVSNQTTQYPESEGDLKKAIPDHPLVIDILPAKYHETMPYIVHESKNLPGCQGTPETLFYPTKAGYICAEQNPEDL